MDAVERRARDAMAEKHLPAVADNDFTGFADRMAARYQGAQCRYFTMVALARHFQGAKSFAARLDLVLAHLPEARSADLRDLLDSFAADCVESPQLVTDLLGHQPNLAAALGTLGDLACGKGGGAANSSLAKLRNLIGEGAMPLTAASLWDRILRELNRGRSLSRTDEKQEWNALMRLSDRLLACCPPERMTVVQSAIRIACDVCTTPPTERSR